MIPQAWQEQLRLAHLESLQRRRQIVAHYDRINAEWKCDSQQRLAKVVAAIRRGEKVREDAQ
jgi:hypothetical protein